jgi:hypothetical protein
MSEQKPVPAVRAEVYGPRFGQKSIVAAWRTKASQSSTPRTLHMLSSAMEPAPARGIGVVAMTPPTCHIAMLELPKRSLTWSGHNDLNK